MINFRFLYLYFVILVLGGMNERTISFAQENFLRLTPQFVEKDLLIQSILPLLSPKAELKYLEQYQTLLIQDDPKNLGQVKAVFEFLNQAPQEIELQVRLLETARPLEAFRSWRDVEAQLKENPALLDLAIKLNGNEREKLIYASSIAGVGGFRYEFLTEVKGGEWIALQSFVEMDREAQLHKLQFQNELLLQRGEVRQILQVPQKGFSGGTGSFLSIFVEGLILPRLKGSLFSQLEGEEEASSTRSAPTSVAEGEVEAPEVALQGIIYLENNPRNSFAFLKRNGVSQQVKVGMVFEGLKIVTIQKNYVMVEYQGKEFKFFLE
jgi:hypothetical protein